MESHWLVGVATRLVTATLAARGRTGPEVRAATTIGRASRATIKLDR